MKKMCMLVKKIKWVNDVGKFAQGSSIEGRFEESISKTVYQNLVNLTNLLINLAVKARAKKME